MNLAGWARCPSTRYRAVPVYAASGAPLLVPVAAYGLARTAMKIVLRLAAWFALLGIVIATLSPIGLRPHTWLPVDLERALAYAGIGVLFALGYPRHILKVVLFLTVCIFALEAFQHLTPDRHGQIHDAWVKFAGAVAGLILGAAAHWLVAKRSVSNAIELPTGSRPRS